MKTAADILADVQDIEELRAGHAAALAACEAALTEAARAQQRMQQASQELRAWGEALELFGRAARFMHIIESN
jgi:hypothetical protein